MLRAFPSQPWSIPLGMFAIVNPLCGSPEIFACFLGFAGSWRRRARTCLSGPPTAGTGQFGGCSSTCSGGGTGSWPARPTETSDFPPPGLFPSQSTSMFKVCFPEATQSRGRHVVTTCTGTRYRFFCFLMRTRTDPRPVVTVA